MVPVLNRTTKRNRIIYRPHKSYLSSFYIDDGRATQFIISISKIREWHGRELVDGIIKYFDERGGEEDADHQKNSKK
jgi:hypothetical protein